jgi:hypothetical protein
VEHEYLYFKLKLYLIETIKHGFIRPWAYNAHIQRDTPSLTHAHNRVILYFNMSFGRELVVLLTKPSMFGKFVVYGGSVEV